MTQAKPMSALRRRMIDDMTLRNLSPATQRSYLHAVTKFSRHFGGPPDRLGLEDARLSAPVHGNHAPFRPKTTYARCPDFLSQLWMLALVVQQRRTRTGCRESFEVEIE
jgi:hypothetical protein